MAKRFVGIVVGALLTGTGPDSPETPMEIEDSDLPMIQITDEWVGAGVVVSGGFDDDWRCEALSDDEVMVAGQDEIAEHYDHAVALARESWDIYRKHCQKEIDYDPGEGKILIVSGVD